MRSGDFIGEPIPVYMGIEPNKNFFFIKFRLFAEVFKTGLGENTPNPKKLIWERLLMNPFFSFV